MNEEGYPERRQRKCCSRNALCGLSIFLTVCLILALICLAAVSYCLFIKLKENSTFCSEPQCIASSAEIGEFIDDSIDPCDDFHSFVCNKFTKTAYEKQLTNPLKAEYDRLENKISSFIIEPESEDDLLPVIMQKRYFQACLDEEEMDKNNSIFFSLLNEIGGWPILKAGKWKKDYFDWMRVMVRTRQIGVPFNWFLDIDIHDGRFLKIGKPKDCDTMRDNLSPEYNDMIAHIVQNLTNSNIESMRAVFDISNFQQRLAGICAKVENDSVTVSPVIALEKMWPKDMMECRKFIREITGQPGKWQLDTEIAYDRDYIVRLHYLLQNTSKEIQANYIGWKIMENFAPFLSKPIRKIHERYIEAQTDEQYNRFEFCLADTKSKFHLVSDTMFIQTHATPEIREAGEEMVKSIKDELLSQIEEVEWMRNATKKTYSDLYERMNVVIGGPKEIFYDDVFTKYLHVGQLRFSSPNIIYMITEWSRNNFSTKIETIKNAPLSSPLDAINFASPGLSVYTNADQSKTIFVPTTLFYGTTYDINRPQYLNYAGLGTLIATKLVEGTLVLMDEHMEKNYYDNFERNQQCLIKSLEASDNELNAAILARSIYADLVGRNIAFGAYQKYVEDNGEEEGLPGLPYAPNQLFWIKSSMNWCFQDLPNEEARPEVNQMLKHRIIETAKNSPYFSENFECEDRATMNPIKKCKII